MVYWETLTVEDLYSAYKKAKFELYNDKNSVGTMALLKYEKSLKKNIEGLLKDIQKNGLKNISCKHYFELPKSLKFQDEHDCHEKHVHFFSSSQNHHKFNEKENIELTFRKVVNADINFHIISALWIAKIGQYIDEKFGHNIYGSRLVRIKPTNTSSCEFDVSSQEYNIDSPRIFDPYQYRYQNWRNNSFKAIRELHKTSSVIAVTMDITSFYHNVTLNTFLEDTFYQSFGLNEHFKDALYIKTFHEDFIGLLEQWNKSINSKNGLPIGLSASSVLANAIMQEFDTKIEANLAPTYYGRYVDDILLVFPDNGNMKNGEDVLDYLVSKKIVKVNKKDKLKYKNFEFKKEKQKIFYLDKEADLSIIDAIEAEINSVSSEWRFMPDLADKNSLFMQKIVGFYADGNEFNDALRKIDAATIKRLGLSLLISHSHGLNQYVRPKEWKERRYAIYDLIENHIFIPKNFINNFTFIPKIFRLMVHSEDGERAYCFLEKVFEQINQFDTLSNKTLKSSNKKEANFFKFIEYTYYILQQVFIESFNLDNKMPKRYSEKIISKLFHDQLFEETFTNGRILYDEIQQEIRKKSNKSGFDNLHIPIDKFNESIVKDINSYLFLRDLSFDAYATSVTESMLSNKQTSFFKRAISSMPGSLSNFTVNFTKYTNFILIIDDFNSLLDDKKTSNFPLIFPTRPFSALDISIISSLSNGKNEALYLSYINCLRGTHSISGELAEPIVKNEFQSIVRVTNKHLKKKKSVNIAITNYEVENIFWIQSVIQKPIMNIKRYKQLEHIVNEAVKKRPDYLILPELSIPQEWAWLISKKLLANDISLIAGVEYTHSKEKGKKIVHNSIMKFLVADDIGFKYMKFFRQDKQVGAHAESIELKNIANIELKPKKAYEDKNIYKHGNFYFSSLICNELTDIEYRMKFRGKIDALFIVEWNKDIKSFNALVESASLDIHSYIVQVNNRNYGDSRIRAPYKDDFNRDIVQVKGGKHDYLIVGEINIEQLREFQSHQVSPAKPFKPVPTGFKMLQERKEWDNEEDDSENI